MPKYIGAKWDSNTPRVRKPRKEAGFRSTIPQGIQQGIQKPNTCSITRTCVQFCRTNDARITPYHRILHVS